MIAEVYPLMRTPRKMRVFDYEVPSAIEQNVKRGSFVTIPFRDETLMGVVARIKDVPLRGITLKSIRSIDDRITLSENELSFFESLAEELVQSVSSILHLAIPEFPKRISSPQQEFISSIPFTIPVSETAHLQQQAKQLCERRQAFVYSSDIRRSAALIAFYFREKSDQKTLILAPNVLDAKHLAEALAFLRPILLTGEEDGKRRFDAWRIFREQKSGLIIGTKTAVFSLPSDVTSIFFVRANHKNHGQHEQNPYYDVRTIASFYAERSSVNLFHLDVMPIVDDFIQFPEACRFGFPAVNPHAQLIDLEQERMHKSSLSVLTYRTQEIILVSLETQKPVLCILNKTDRSRATECAACHTVMRCLTCQTVLRDGQTVLSCVRCGTSEPKLQACPLCKSALFVQKGISHSLVASELQNQFPHARICHLDAQHPDLDKQADVIVATRYYLESLFHPFQPFGFGSVILLDADTGLFSPSFRALEETLYDIEMYRSVARANHAEFYVQTTSPQLYEDFFADPVRFFANELRERRDFHLPPFTHTIRLRLQESEKRKSELVLNSVIQKIRNEFPDVILRKLPGKTSDQSLIEIGVLLELRASVLEFLRTFPDSIRIDTHADFL